MLELAYVTETSILWQGWQQVTK